MTKRFETFKAALEALCNEHGVGIQHAEWKLYVSDLDDESEPFAFHEYDLDDETKPRQEDGEAYQEMLLSDAERAERQRVQHQIWAETRRADEARRLAALHSSEPFKTNYETAMADAAHERNMQMRISTDPTDPAFVDARPRRVWVNEKEITGWVTADEFRRCVTTSDGVLNGSVLIERLPEPGAPVVDDPVECASSLSGIMEKVPEEHAADPAPSFAVPSVPVKAAPVARTQSKKSKRAR